MSLDLAKVAALAAMEKTDEPITVLDVQNILAITDYFVISSGKNSRQVKAIVDEVNKKVKLAGSSPPRQVEGLGELEWVLLDYGTFVVHVFSTEARSLYSLERLWEDAERVDVASKEVPVATSAVR
ncbi:MAG: ribosome silencing factor [Firmicutes bacterium]|nr:ribosome silencing factor [Bacillota bacterium]